jgi:ferric-dicitrate binding protein FerR (iron transport regulator)
MHWILCILQNNIVGCGESPSHLCKWRNQSMIVKSWVVICLSILLGFQPVGWAASPVMVGKIVAEGAAQINGSPAPKGTTLFADDRIVTQKDGNASLALTGGGQLILVDSSSVQMKQLGGQLTAALDHGALAVFNRGIAAPIIVQAGGARIRPGKDGAVYAVTLVGEKLEVFAKKGVAEVEAANRTVEVHEGETLEATMAPADPPQTAAGAGKTSPLGRLDKVLIVVGVAAGVTVLGIAVRALEKTCTATPSPFKVSCS